MIGIRHELYSEQIKYLYYKNPHWENILPERLIDYSIGKIDRSGGFFIWSLNGNCYEILFNSERAFLNPFPNGNLRYAI